MSEDWFYFPEIEDLPSPALVFYRERIDENIRRMLELAGSAEKVRPHIKTHKCPEILRLHLERGIRKFKCATMAELEMAVKCGAKEVLLAYQPVGPNARRLALLARAFSGAQLSAVIDDRAAAERLSGEFERAKAGVLRVLVDLDVGMHRTGIRPGSAFLELCRAARGMTGLKLAGIHAYDGQIHHSDPSQREKACDDAFVAVSECCEHLRAIGVTAPTVVAGGTPTFPVHARRPGVECSPGTYVLWDFGYGQSFPDLPFLPAALLLTRVVSKPSSGRLCLDLGHKAVAAEQPPPRLRFLTLPDAKEVMHSEEHLVVESAGAERIQVGDALLAMPRHICPTVALHSRAAVVESGHWRGIWKISARERALRY